MSEPDEVVKLFVYGTLRTPPGVTSDDTRNYEFVATEVLSSGPATFHGADLLSFIHYPGITPGERTVTGDLLEVTRAGLEICDGIESHPDFFRRSEISVTTDSGDERAWVYWAPAELISTGELIKSGDWFDRDRSRIDGRTLDEALAQDRAAQLERSGRNEI